MTRRYGEAPTDTVPDPPRVGETVAGKYQRERCQRAIVKTHEMRHVGGRADASREPTRLLLTHLSSTKLACASLPPCGPESVRQSRTGQRNS